ncbi:MAG: family transporter [Paucimonas sp.]|nr:family transporter [Paucimonas sp.]
MSFAATSEQRQTLMWLALGLLLVGLLVLLGPVLTPFLAAGILAYVLNPGVDWLAQRGPGRARLPRTLAVILVMSLLFATMLALVLIVIPVLQKELPLMREQVPQLLSTLDQKLAPLLAKLGVTARLDVDGIKILLTEQIAHAGQGLWTSLLSSVRIGGLALLGWLATLLLVPVVLFYLLLDWHAVLARLADSVPRRWAVRTLAFGREVDALLAQYLRGQLLVMLVLAVYYSVGLALAGLDVALPVGILTGLLVFIPYVGFGIGLVLALLAALLQFGPLQGLVAVGIVYGLGQVLEGFILTPRLVGERIGLHPLVVIFALLAFGQLFGFVGVLLALPASAVLSVAARHMHHHYQASSFYTRLER